jgi:hypothetical protein
VGCLSIVAWQEDWDPWIRGMIARVAHLMAEDPEASGGATAGKA